LVDRRPPVQPHDSSTISRSPIFFEAGVVVGAGEDQFVAQIEHEHVCVALIESSEGGCIGLGCKDDGDLRFSDDTRGAMIRESGFSARDDFLSFVCEENDKIIES